MPLIHHHAHVRRPHRCYVHRHVWLPGGREGGACPRAVYLSFEIECAQSPLLHRQRNHRGVGRGEGGFREYARYLSLSRSICLSLSPSLSLTLNLSDSLSLFLSISLSLYLSVSSLTLSLAYVSLSLSYVSLSLSLSALTVLTYCGQSRRPHLPR